MLPDFVRMLLWDVDPEEVRLPAHRDYVLERVMARGGWAAMCWVRTSFAPDVLRDFLARKGGRLPARERAYWSLVAGMEAPHARGGGRPSWAG